MPAWPAGRSKGDDVSGGVAVRGGVGEPTELGMAILNVPTSRAPRAPNEDIGDEPAPPGGAGERAGDGTGRRTKLGGRPLKGDGLVSSRPGFVTSRSWMNWFTSLLSPDGDPLLGALLGRSDGGGGCCLATAAKMGWVGVDCDEPLPWFDATRAGAKTDGSTFVQGMVYDPEEEEAGDEGCGVAPAFLGKTRGCRLRRWHRRRPTNSPPIKQSSNTESTTPRVSPRSAESCVIWISLALADVTASRPPASKLPKLVLHELGMP